VQSNSKGSSKQGTEKTNVQDGERTVRSGGFASVLT
jgi:hypothetical protein